MILFSLVLRFLAGKVDFACHAQDLKEKDLKKNKAKICVKLVKPMGHRYYYGLFSLDHIISLCEGPR
jgi:hypothetical protein